MFLEVFYNTPCGKNNYKHVYRRSVSIYRLRLKCLSFPINPIQIAFIFFFILFQYNLEYILD